MTDIALPMLVLASDYRVDDPSRVVSLLQNRESALSEIGAHHVLVYASTLDPGRVLVLIWVRNHEPVVDLLRSRVFFDWFDAVGVTDIPGVFAGEIAEEVHVVDSSMAKPPGVVVAVMTRVADVATLTAKIHAALSRFAAAGIRKLWIYRAFDDPCEVLLVQEIESEAIARRWIDHPDAVADWMISAGADAYPPLFVGRFVHMARIHADDH
jgi:hypothetical protein